MIKIKNTFQSKHSADEHAKKMEGTPGISLVSQNEIIGYNGQGNETYYQVVAFDEDESKTLFKWKYLYSHAEEVTSKDYDYKKLKRDAVQDRLESLIGKMPEEVLEAQNA